MAPWFSLRPRGSAGWRHRTGRRYLAL